MVLSALLGPLAAAATMSLDRSFAEELPAERAPAGDPPVVQGAALVPVSFSSIVRWSADDHRAALAAFQRTCRAFADFRPLAEAAGAELLAGVCRAAVAQGSVDRASARQFFERQFDAYRVEVPGGGFLTAYFEPEIEGSRERSARFSVPLLERPDDLVPLTPGRTPGLDPRLTAARRVGERLEPFPDRGAIEEGALGAAATPLVFVDPVDAFVAHVQGSVRVKLAEGTAQRLAYAGKNGQPYTSIGRVLARELAVPPAEMTMDRVVTWLNANSVEARRVMRLNRSYIFFRRADELVAGDGPLGAAGVQLTAGRSIAIDHALWSYGLPYFLETRLPEPDGGVRDVARTVVGQDTGTAIVGPSRADLFLGSGADAGLRAGLVREPMQLIVLWPKGLAVERLAVEPSSR